MSDDAISRQAAIKLFLGKVHDEYPMLSDVMIGILESLSPVAPKQSENTMMDAAIDEWRGEMDNVIKRALGKQIEVLDKIRAEIEERKNNSGGEPNRDLAFNVCLQIIDKYKAESEDES